LLLLSLLRLLSVRGSRLLNRIRHRRGWQRFRSQTKYFLEEAALVAGLLVACLLWLSSRDERGRIVVRTAGGGNAVGDLVQIQHDDAIRRRERLHIAIGRQRYRLLHEVSPDRRSGMCPF